MSIPIQLNHSPTQTVRSHGWVLLAPFNYDQKRSKLNWAMGLPDAGPSECSLIIDENAKTLLIDQVKHASEADVVAIVKAVKRMFRATEDFGPFWRRIDDVAPSELTHVIETRAGALLRAPTLFEDFVKSLLTVNCTWRNTQSMVSNLCRTFGRRVPGTSSWTFPEPLSVATVSESELRSAGLGFRSKYVLGAAIEFASNTGLEARWESIKDTARLRKEIIRFPGVGPYVGNHMLVMLGHYSYIPSDSTTRSYLGISTRAARYAAEEEVNRRFAAWGPFAALAYHFTRKGISVRIPGQ